MQLQLSSWPEVEAYLARSKAILIPIGSTEQHGPNGLLPGFPPASPSSLALPHNIHVLAQEF
jgi:creatinine amidohydrolase